MLEHAAGAIMQVFRPDNVVFLLVGVVGGMAVGALPGLTATMALALLVPFTFTMSPDTALVMLGGLYTAAMYSDAIPAILINTPGTPAAVATAFDGYPMSRQGRAQEALAAAAVASGLGGVIGGVFLLALSPPLAAFGLQFGPPEYFWLSVFGLTIIATLASHNVLQGLAGGAIGLLLGTVGIAPIGGDVRFTFGFPQLQAGITLVVALIGLFCIPQVLLLLEGHRRTVRVGQYEEKSGVFRSVLLDTLRRPGNLLRSSVIGTIVGIIPGAGGSIASLISYNEATRWSRDKRGFGQGRRDGVVASEAANSSQVPGALIPMLTLGIPGAPPAAVVLGVLLLHGLRPGRDLYTVHADIVYTFIFSLFFGSLVTLVVGGIGSRWFSRLTGVPIRFIAPLVIFLSFIGAYAIRNNTLDVGIMLAFGPFGYVTQKLGFHPGPIVLGLILGPYAEQGLVQSMLMGRASGSVLALMFTRPISLILIALCLLSALWPVISRRLGHGTALPAGDPGGEGSGSGSAFADADAPPRPRTIRADVWAGVLVLAIAAIAYRESRSFTELGGVFVDAVVFITALLGAAMVVSGMGRPRFVPLTAEPDADLAAVGVTVAGLVVYGFALPAAGFLPASIAFVVALVAFLTLRAAHPLPMAAVVVPALLVIGLCLLFQYGFAVPLPAGAWRGGAAAFPVGSP